MHTRSLRVLMNLVFSRFRWDMHGTKRDIYLITGFQMVFTTSFVINSINLVRLTLGVSPNMPSVEE